MIATAQSFNQGTDQRLGVHRAPARRCRRVRGRRGDESARPEVERQLYFVRCSLEDLERGVKQMLAERQADDA